MLASQKYQNKKIAVYGLGITGVSTALFLKKLKNRVYCWDDNSTARRQAKGKKLEIVKFWLQKNSIDNIVISPGIDINKCNIKNYLRKNSNKIITDLDIFFDLNKKKQIISITGTNGKSTTCKILEKILREAKHKVRTVGNIGNPILSSSNSKKGHTFILEVSSYQLEYSKTFRSTHSAILNISPDHLDRHKNIKKYVKIKSKIFFAQKKPDYTYINLSNKYLNLICKIFKYKKIKSKLILINKDKYKFLLKKIVNKYFNNEGNIENLSFAYEIAKNLKVNDKTIINALNKFKGLPHRQEIVFDNDKLLCVNDSKATSFDACTKSLLNYNKIYWILGGKEKFKDYFYIKKFKKKIIKAYIIGQNPLFFKKQIKKHIPYIVSNNVNSAINSIYNDIKISDKKKSTILLSPAAASFDQFKNFEKRGTHFKNLVLKKFKNEFNV